MNSLTGGLMRPLDMIKSNIILSVCNTHTNSHSQPVDSIMERERFRQIKATTFPWFSSNEHNRCQKVILIRSRIGHTRLTHTSRQTISSHFHLLQIYDAYIISHNKTTRHSSPVYSGTSKLLDSSSASDFQIVVY